MLCVVCTGRAEDSAVCTGRAEDVLYILVALRTVLCCGRAEDSAMCSVYWLS